MALAMGVATETVEVPPVHVREAGPQPARRPQASAGSDERRALRRQGWIAFAVVALVGGLDQVAKAWAWRHLAHVQVDAGGGMLTDPEIGAWFSNPRVGALIDVAGATVLAAAGVLLLRRHRSTPVLVSAAVALAGWASNLADRLGAHYVTAPGSMRGAVDFLSWAGRSWNLADMAISFGTFGLVVAGIRLALHRLSGRRHPRRHLVRRPLARRRYRIAALVGILVVAALAALGAVASGGVDSPVPVFAQPVAP
jgi:lipoprotein signal peptidase